MAFGPGFDSRHIHPMHQYFELVSNVTREAKREGIILAPDCLCLDPKCARMRRGNWEPEDYSSWRKSVERWAHHCVFKTLFWGVHLNGRHLVHVENEYGLTWQGPVRFTHPLKSLQSR